MYQLATVIELALYCLNTIYNGNLKIYNKY
jgi:hypothetical protein